MPETLLNTREVAAYLQINEKQVYRLIRNGSIPCTRVTGKWVFPQSLVEEWVHRSARAKTSAATRPVAVAERFGLDRGLLIAGSDDLLLAALFELARFHFPPTFDGVKCASSIVSVDLGCDGSLISNCKLPEYRRSRSKDTTPKCGRTGRLACRSFDDRLM